MRRSDDGTRALEIRYRGGSLDVFGTQVPIAAEGDGKALALHVFLDKSIIEVFINGGKQTVARVMAAPAGDMGIEAFTDGTCSVDLWKLKCIW